MTTTTVTSKGQVTIPKRVRDALGLRRGSKVEFAMTELGRAYVQPVGKKPRKSEIRKRLESVRGTMKLGMSTDEYMKLMRGDD
jgi:AbrB family looped-hinge helix DNA binding protein